MRRDQVCSIHLSGVGGDILVFMTGQEDIETTCEVVAGALLPAAAGRCAPFPSSCAPGGLGEEGP